MPISESWIIDGAYIYSSRASIPTCGLCGRGIAIRELHIRAVDLGGVYHQWHVDCCANAGMHAEDRSWRTDE